MITQLSKRIEHFLHIPPSERSAQSAAGLSVGSLKGPARKDNQDRAAVVSITSADGRSFIVALVCDGLGGMLNGGLSATIAASTFISKLAQSIDHFSVDVISDAVFDANDAVYERMRGDGGTTLTALILDHRDKTWVAHVGDSRLYSNINSGKLSLLTRDDTMAAVVQERGKIDEDSLDNRLLQFVGIGAALEPHIGEIKNPSSRRFFITSDGAHGLGRTILEGISTHANSCSDLVRKLTFVAEASGVQDNASVVAFSREEFVREPAFYGGLTVKIWSPTDTLEIWFHEPSKITKLQHERLNPEIAKASTIKSKKTVKGKTKSSRSNVRPSSQSEDRDTRKKPQLNIDFGSLDDNKND